MGALFVFISLHATLPNEVTVYFTKPSNWNSANIWAWWWDGSSDKNIFDSWPGPAMQKVLGSTDLYSITISLGDHSYNEFYIKFSNNGNNETGGFTVDGNNMRFTSSGNSSFSSLGKTITVFFRKPHSGWSDDIKVWAWQRNNNSSSNISSGDFPGNFTMTQIGKTDYYKYDIPWNSRSGQLGVLFVGKNGNNQIQTDNFYITDNNQVFCNNHEEKWYLVGTNYDNYAVKEENRFSFDPTLGIWTLENIDFKKGGFEIFDGTSSWNDSFGKNTSDDFKIGNMYYCKSHGGQITSNEEMKNADIAIDPSNYTLTVVSHQNPDNLYLYGDLKDKTWEEDDYYTAENKNGIYTFTDVYVRGQKKDLNENYIAFFASVDSSDDNTVGYGNMLPRFGCKADEANFNVTNVQIKNTELKSPVTKNLSRYLGNNDYNYCLPQGIYDIEVNLNNMTVKFTKVDLSYQWFDHADSKITENSHSTTYGVNNKIQLGARDNTRHIVADLAEFKVEYEPLQSTSLKGVKARATSVTGQNEYYSIDDNYVMTLNKAGNYTITASLPEDYSSDYYGIQPSTLNVAVAALDVTVSWGSPDPQAFNPAGANTMEGVLAITSSSELTYGTNGDYTISVVPVDGDNWTKAGNSNLTTAYEQAFTGSTGSLMDQLNALGGVNVRVDGFYSEVGVDDINPALSSSSSNDENTTYTYNVAVTFPCSGEYTLAFVPNSDENYAVSYVNDASSSTIQIYPNLVATFGTGKGAEKGFNVSGYQVGEEEDGYYVVAIKDDLANMDNFLKNCIGFIPGTYFASSLTTSAYQTQQVKARKVTGADIKYRVDLDLTGANTTDGKFFTVNVTKNGVTGSYNFKAITSANYNTSTGVEGIEAPEEGEAVYYNLQGVKVENPEKGLYIKVVGGKSEKVIY